MMETEKRETARPGRLAGRRGRNRLAAGERAMKFIAEHDDQVDVRLAFDELVLLHNMLDEVLNGFELGEEEFQAIFDVQRQEAEALLLRMSGILERLQLALDIGH
jgi:hypothetical protein